MGSGSFGGMIISFDPGATCAGVAVFEDYELTWAAGIVGDNWLETAVRAASEIVKMYPSGVYQAARTVIERPQVYGPRQQKGRQKDLITITLAAGAFVGALGVVDVVEHQPAQWKGQVTKEVTKSRVMEGLSINEFSRIQFPKQKSLHHNVYDAVALGMFELGRYQ